MTVAEVAQVGHLEAWSMPYRYAIAVLDLAIERRGESTGTVKAKSEPVITPGGHQLPPGMSQMARMFGWA